MDIITINELSIETTIGVHAWEQQIKQKVVIDLQLGTDISVAASKDSLEDTLDYDAIAKRVCAFVAESKYKLIESLAEKTAQLIQEEFAVQWLRLSLKKPGAVRGAKSVGVVIER